MMGPAPSVCAERIKEVLDTASSVVHPADAVTELPGAASLELRDVGFNYPGAEQPVLRDITFTRRGRARPPPSSAAPARARPTLLNLIPRLFDATDGQVLVDGVDVRDLDPELLVEPHRPRPAEAVPVLGHGGHQPALRQPGRHRRASCGRRSRSPRPATSWPPCPAASTPASPRAAPTCRAASASASPSPGPLVRKPGIYLFDDSFSALDLATDARLRAALAPVIADAATVLIVAQRVSTIMHADQILVLEDGRERRPRHPPRAARDLPDLRRDRGLPARDRGGGGMTANGTNGASGDGARATARSASRTRSRSPASASAVNAGTRFGVGMPVERSKDFRNSTRRLAAPAAARAARASSLVLAARRRQRARSTCIGPKILGHATNIIVAGHPEPAAASTSPTLHNALLLGARPLRRRRRVLSYTAGLHARRRRAALDVPAARRRRGQAQPAARSRYVDRQPRGDLLSRVTNDIDNVAQSLQQTLSQMLTSVLTHHRRDDHDVHDLAAAGARSRSSPSRSRCSPCRLITARSKKRFVAQWRHTGTLNAPGRGGLHRPRARARCSAASTTSRRRSTRRTRSCTRPASARSSSPASSSRR